MARVIFIVDCTERMRRRTTRSLAPIGGPRSLPPLPGRLPAAGLGGRAGLLLEPVLLGLGRALLGRRPRRLLALRFFLFLRGEPIPADVGLDLVPRRPRAGRRGGARP